MARTPEPSPSAGEVLAQLVGEAWRGTDAQACALARVLRTELAPAHLVVLGEVWEAAVAALSARPAPLTRLTATRLLRSWLKLAASRSDEWRRPRHQRGKQGRPVVRPEADISVVARWDRY